MPTNELSQTGFTYEELEDKYHRFLSPTFQVLINGSDISKDAAISYVEVETSIEAKAGTFSFSVVNAFDPVSREFKWLDDDFALGTYVEIKMGYLDKLECVMYGLITSVNCDFSSETMPRIVVRGMDVSFLMMRGTKSKSWEKKKYSEIAEEIGRTYASSVIADDTSDVIDIVVQNESSDFQMLTDLALMTNSDFFIVGRSMYFRGPLKGTVPVVTLVWGKTLHRFSPEMNLAAQVGDIVVRGWDMNNQELIEATSGQVKKLGSNRKTGKDIMNGLGDFKEYVYTNVESAQEAQDHADALLNQRAMQLITGEGECSGIPELTAGRYIKLEGVGKKLSQPYYLREVTHIVDNSGYRVFFKVGGNAV